METSSRPLRKQRSTSCGLSSGGTCPRASDWSTSSSPNAESMPSVSSEGRGAVLDASALLALINSEPGAERVVQALPGACISAVNLSEVAGKLVDKGVSEADVDSHLDG